MENVNDQMQEFTVVEPFDRKACPLLEGIAGECNDEVLPLDCKKEVVDLGAVPNEVITV